MEKKISQKMAQQIVDTVKDVCGQDINFIDRDGIIFASTNPKRINGYHEIGKQVVFRGTAIEVESDDSFYGTKKGVNIPFQYNGEIIAAIGISGAPEEVRKYAYLAQKITTLIFREQELDVQNHNQKTQFNYVIHSLISNQHMNPQYFNDFIRKYKISQTSLYQTILIQLDSRYNPSNLSMIEQKIYQTFDSTGSSLYTFQYPNEYILLLETALLTQWKYLFEKLADEYNSFLKIGIGSSHPLSEQYQSYNAAQIALKSLAAPRNLAYFEQLDLEILLGNVSADARDFFLHKTIEKLTEKDCSLLKTYFSCEMSLKKTCDLLFMHKNTLQYQLDRIWHTCGYNPRTFQDAAVLYMALKFLPLSNSF